MPHLASTLLPRRNSPIRYLAAGILLAGLAAAASAQALAEEIEEGNVLAYAAVKLNGTLGRFAVGMRTSDFLASEKYCLTKDGVGCSIEDEHRSTPKNIGNVLCLPYGRAHVVTERCLELLNAGREAGCQRNSNGGTFSCQGLPRVEPYCNYRTEATGNADWYWTVTEANDVMTIDCEQRGYIGFTPKNAGDEVAIGCLGRGRLHAFAIGEQPLRPCRLNETQISIPAAMRQ